MNRNIKNLTGMFVICAITALSGCGKVASDLSKVKEERNKFVKQCAKYGHAEAQHNQGPDAPPLEKFQEACGCYYDKGIEAYPDKKNLPRAVLSLSKGEDAYGLSEYMSKGMDACDKAIFKK